MLKFQVVLQHIPFLGPYYLHNRETQKFPEKGPIGTSLVAT